MEPTEEQFLKDVKEHYIEIARDEGVYRHIVMSSGSYNTKYHITTWPGYLCFSGDMGCFVFSRIEDMLQFFRQLDNKLRINKPYWHEKLESVDRCSGSKEYSGDLFRKAIKEYYESWFEDENFGDENGELWEAIEADVLCRSGDGESAMVEAVTAFSYEGFTFDDFFGGHSFQQYTYRFIWCLYAIVYAIQLYDKSAKSVAKKD